MGRHPVDSRSGLLNAADNVGLMDGTFLARQILAKTGERAARFKERAGRTPCLAVVLMDDDPASVTYVKLKQARCRDAGVALRVVELHGAVTTGAALRAVRVLSEDPEVDGILVQHPLAAHVNERAVFEAITPSKDIDGVTAHSFGAMALGMPGFASCTPAGIIRLLDEYAVDPAGKHAVVLGRSPILGKPMGMLLLARNATVTYCHSSTRDLRAHVASADILVAAVGRPKFVRGEWLKPGTVVVDTGYNEDNAGDVAFDEARPVASLITPVPGGVGPMTIALLIEQTVTAAELAYGRRMRE
jgi:methylenetetrahydrofolate dehydrogenase (NADP+)/methenyltetrahydrofolate cyclohydrolase